MLLKKIIIMTLILSPLEVFSDYIINAPLNNFKTPPIIETYESLKNVGKYDFKPEKIELSDSIFKELIFSISAKTLPLKCEKGETLEIQGWTHALAAYLVPGSPSQFTVHLNKDFTYTSFEYGAKNYDKKLRKWSIQGRNVAKLEGLGSIYLYNFTWDSSEGSSLVAKLFFDKPRVFNGETYDSALMEYREQSLPAYMTVICDKSTVYFPEN